MAHYQRSLMASSKKVCKEKVDSASGYPYVLIMTRAQHASRPHRESLSKRLGAKARRIRERDGNRCAYCGATEGPLHLDHIIPRSQGGPDVAENLIVACASCNSRRQDMSLRRYMRYLREQLCWTATETTACLRRVRRQLAKIV